MSYLSAAGAEVAMRILSVHLWRTVLYTVVFVMGVIMLAACGGGNSLPLPTSTPTVSGPSSPERRPTLEPTPGEVGPATQPAGPALESNDQFTIYSAELDADADGWVTFDAIETAMPLALADYSWPTGFDLNSDDVLKTFTGGKAMGEDRFGVGFEHLLLSRWHSCVWYEAWLDAYAHGDREAAKRALAIMTDVLPRNPSIHPESVDRYEARAQQAALGDPALVQQFVDANCTVVDLNQYYSDDGSPETTPAGTSSVGTAPPAASGFDVDGDGLYTLGELKQAVSALLPAYTWPEKYQVTTELMVSGFASEPKAQFAVPYEYTLVGFYHLCAWERAWLDAHRTGDEALQRESMSQLQEVALNNTAFSGIHDYLKTMFDGAILGDAATMQQFVDSSCSTYQFITPVPSMS